MTDCGCRKGAIMLGCERHDPQQSVVSRPFPFTLEEWLALKARLLASFGMKS